MTQVIFPSGDISSLKNQVAIYLVVNSSGVCPADYVQILPNNFPQIKSQVFSILPLDSNGNSLA